MLHVNICSRTVFSVIIHLKHNLHTHTDDVVFGELSYFIIEFGQYPCGFGLVITGFLRRLRDLLFTNGLLNFPIVNEKVTVNKKISITIIYNYLIHYNVWSFSFLFSRPLWFQQFLIKFTVPRKRNKNEKQHIERFPHYYNYL